MAPETPADPVAAAVAELPRRVAHVTHALMEAWTASGSPAPLTAAEICEYDSEALSARSTGAALTQARKRGLVSCAPHGDAGIWWATDRAWEMRRALEDRVLAEEDSRA